MSDRPVTPLLDKVSVPADIRSLSKEQLPQLADELRQETISAVSVTGGHLGAGLGVVELTAALHYVFDTPNDKLIWAGRSETTDPRTAGRLAHSVVGRVVRALKKDGLLALMQCYETRACDSLAISANH